MKKITDIRKHKSLTRKEMTTLIYTIFCGEYIDAGDGADVCKGCYGKFLGSWLARAQQSAWRNGGYRKPAPIPSQEGQSLEF